MRRRFGPGSERVALDAAIAALDLTTLEGRDTPQTVLAICARATAPGAGVPPVAAVCVYPALVATAVAALRGTGVAVASVATGFPAGLVPLNLRLGEIGAAVAADATEIDVVIDRGAFLAGRFRDVRDEVAEMREACAGATCKVILEAGELGSYAAIAHAAALALDGGADVVKTATGKIAVASTPPSALVLAESVREHGRRTGRVAGVKLAGGIRTASAALGYLALISETLGPGSTDPARFRIGASSLLDDLLARRATRAA